MKSIKSSLNHFGANSDHFGRGFLFPWNVKIRSLHEKKIDQKPFRNSFTKEEGDAWETSLLTVLSPSPLPLLHLFGVFDAVFSVIKVDHGSD